MHNLVLHAVLLLDFKVLELFLLIVLLLDNLGLFGLFSLRLEDRLLHLPLLILSLLIHGVVVLGHDTLVLILNLVFKDFLTQKTEVKTIQLCRQCLPSGSCPRYVSSESRSHLYAS